MNIYFRGLLAALFVIGCFATLYFVLTKEDTYRHGLVDQLEQQGLIDFDGQDYLRQKPFQLSGLKGRIIILNFWASWCEPCAKEIPDMVKLVEKYEGKLALVAVSNDENEAEMASFIKAFGGLSKENVFIVRDPERKIAKQYEVFKLPESFIFDVDGHLDRKVVGYVDWYNQSSLRYIDKLIAGKTQ